MNERFQRITPFLWFDDQAEQAAAYYTGIFDDSRILHVARYDAGSARGTGRPAGSVMVVAFRLDGQDFTALNGGPQFPLTPAVSLVVNCRSQEEIDYCWERLGDGGDPAAQACGWLKDRFGLSWQVVPTDALNRLTGTDPARAARVMQALMRMKKLDLAALEAA